MEETEFLEVFNEEGPLRKKKWKGRGGEEKKSYVNKYFFLF